MSDLAITYLRTSSVLIEYDGHTLLTDPWFSMLMRIVPVFRPPGIALEALPKLDLIVASHLHPDHFGSTPFVKLRIQKWPSSAIEASRTCVKVWMCVKYMTFGTGNLPPSAHLQ